MSSTTQIIRTGNEAAASVAYKLNEVCVLYPITPSSEMSQLCAEWSYQNQPNIFGQTPQTIQMQSEAGVAGTLHGCLQTGSLATSFTSSQGLLLMLPNLYRIAGELSSCVIHVATRSVATHALSVFGDHSDVMAVRQSGFGLLSSSSVQEAQDFALIAQAASLQSRIPFIHFMDGFRTSHETAKIDGLPDHVLEEMINAAHVQAHRERALSPDHPVIRGTSQGSDIFFQSREAQNTYYTDGPAIMLKTMLKFETLTGRRYRPYEYYGHPEAEHIIVIMGSAGHAVKKAVDHANSEGMRTGLLQVRLYRPFSASMLAEVIPASCRQITVLDRTRESGSTGEPLYLDVVQAVYQHSSRFQELPAVYGGRYGLASKEFTPGLAMEIFNRMSGRTLVHNFAAGITDDISNNSIPLPEIVRYRETSRDIILMERHAPGPASAQLANELGLQQYIQCYREISYHKSNEAYTTHIRLQDSPIHSPYTIQQADLVICDDPELVGNASRHLAPEGDLILITSLDNQDLVKRIPDQVLENIRGQKVNLYKTELPGDSEYSMAGQLLLDLENGKDSGLEKLELFYEPSLTVQKSEELNLVDLLLQKNASMVPVSMVPADGTYPTGTSALNPPHNASMLPVWEPDMCTQCGLCSLSCPQAALRIKVYDPGLLMSAPAGMRSAESTDFEGLRYSIAINPSQCNACELCVSACETGALTMQPAESKEELQETWDFFNLIPELDRARIDPYRVSSQQLQEPLFRYARGVDGCSESVYLKLLSQLFGDRLLIANATGSSSIMGGAMPTTPWSKNEEGRGPAWSNSLFEDNAEFGLGFRLSLDLQEERARHLLKKFAGETGYAPAENILNNRQEDEVSVRRQRIMVRELKQLLEGSVYSKHHELHAAADALVRKSVWLVGGDGWASDIGFGGIDHVMATGRNVNILVLDNEVYSNTGGQMSKSTPMGAHAHFAPGGKSTQKKDLGMMMMHYENVYVASVAVGADRAQTLKAFNEAEAFDGPSLILAYCHSPEHGIDMKNAWKQHQLAVSSGQWLLYRGNTGEARSFQMDSPAPVIPVEKYFASEKRFTGTNSRQISRVQEYAYQRYDRVALRSAI